MSGLQAREVWQRRAGDVLLAVDNMKLTLSYRISIWTRQACDVTLTEEDPLMKRIMTIGRHFKASVLGYDVDQKLVTGGFQTEVTFESHKDSEKKGNKARITLGPAEDKEADDKKGSK